MAMPSMHALMVFEVAGRHESFLTAARELNVTPSAVSHQIHSLEAKLGTKLFDRENRKVRLTPRGRTYWKEVSSHFAGLRAETESLMLGNSQRMLTLRCSMVFMRYWLMPRLPQLYEQHPDIEVCFQIAPHNQEPAPDADCGILAGSGHFWDMTSEYLFSGELIPVCSPTYARSHPPIRLPSDLCHHTLLHSRIGSMSWDLWLGADAMAVRESARHLLFDGHGIAYQAAIEGLGVALGRRHLLAAQLLTSQLVAPLGSYARGDESYYLVYRAQEPVLPSFEAFKKWLFGERDSLPLSSPQ